MTITASNISRIQRNFNILIKVYERILAKKRIFSREVAGPSESGFKKFKRLKLTRSSWLNCALRDDEAVYWVMTHIGHSEAVAVGN